MTRKRPLAGIYQITTFLAVVLLLLILFVSAAYFFVIPSPDRSPDEGNVLVELEAKRVTWNSERPASFRYVVDRDCYCDAAYVEPYSATEENDGRYAVFAIEIESATGEFISSPPDPVWIDDLFNVIEQSVCEKKHVDVRYDKELGYPVSIVARPDPAPPDSVYRVEVRDFEILEYR